MATVSLPLRLAVGGELSLTVVTSPRPNDSRASPGRGRKRDPKEPKPFSFPWRKVEFEKRMAAEREAERREFEQRRTSCRLRFLLTTRSGAALRRAVARRVASMVAKWAAQPGP